MSKKRERNTSISGLVPQGSGLLPSLQSQAEETLRAAKKKRPTDRTLPTFDLPPFLREENLPNSAKQSALYEGVKTSTEVLKGLGEVHERLTSLERKVDWQVSRKRSELQDMHAREHSCKRQLRVEISYEPRFQPWQILKDSNAEKQENGDISLVGAQGVELEAPDFDKGTGIPGFDLRISGHLLPLSKEAALEDGEDEIGEKKFTDFVKKLKVELLDRDPDLHTDSQTAEWTSSSTPAQNGFHIRRMASSNLRVRISFTVNHFPERYKVREPLAGIVMMTESTRERCIMGIWSYIKMKGLHDAEDKRYVRCDDALRVICAQMEKVPFHHIGEYVQRFLEPLDPVTIEQYIDVSESFVPTKRAFDIQISVPSPLTTLIGRSLSSLDPSSSTIQSIVRADGTLALLYNSLRSTAIRREFYAYFALSPITFLQTWMNSQAYDLGRLIEGTTRAEVSLPSGGDEHERRRWMNDEKWKGDWTDEAAMVWEQRGQTEMINRRVAQSLKKQ